MSVSLRAAAAVNPAGIDVTLIDATLALTLEERLRQNDRALQTIEELRHAFTTRGPDDPAHAPRGDRG